MLLIIPDCINRTLRNKNSTAREGCPNTHSERFETGRQCADSKAAVQLKALDYTNTISLVVGVFLTLSSTLYLA